MRATRRPFPGRVGLVVLATCLACLAMSLTGFQPARASGAGDGLSNLVQTSGTSGESELPGASATGDAPVTNSSEGSARSVSNSGPRASAPPDPEQVLLDSDRAYERGEYAVAVEGYQKLLGQGLVSGPVLYNLGNSYLRAGSLGRAIASYLRASHYSPRDGNLQANLSFARRSTKDALQPPTAAPVKRTLLFWHYSLGWNELCVSMAVLNVLFWASLVAGWLWRDSELLRWARWVLFIPLLALGASWLLKTVAPTRLAVVISEEISVYAGTSEDSVLRFRLHEGSEARLLDVQDGWAMIELSDGKRGWVQREGIQELSLGGWRQGT